MQNVTYGAERTLINRALKALAEKTEIQATFKPDKKKTAVAQDHVVCLTLKFGGKGHRYLVESKLTVDRKAQLDHIDLRLRQLNSPHLLITEYMSKDLAEHCRQLGLQFIDTHGNAWLRGNSFFVFIVGEKNGGKHASSKAPKGITNAAALRTVFTLLSKPELVSSTLNEIAMQSGVAIGSAYNVMADLEQRGYIITTSKNTRTILEPDMLIDEWVVNFPSRLRTKLNSRRFSCSDPSWWKNINVSEVNAVWGGEVAGAMMLSNLKPVTQTLYIDPSNMPKSINTLAKKIRLKPDPEGAIEILEKFWPPDSETVDGVAPALLVYSDLLSLLDPRAKETAVALREQFINPALRIR